MIFQGNVITDFITEEERSTFINFIDTLTEDDWFDIQPSSDWNHRVFSSNKIRQKNPNLLNLMVNIRDRASSIIKELSGVEKKLYSNGLAIVRWEEGSFQPPHADQPGGYEYREFGSVLYLNDNYEGGNIYFPQYGIDLKPSAGTYAFFPGDIKHLHGVSKIKKNVRYTFPIFWTYDKEYSDGM
jgi:hypothetical protein